MRLHRTTFGRVTLTLSSNEFVSGVVPVSIDTGAIEIIISSKDEPVAGSYNCSLMILDSEGHTVRPIGEHLEFIGSAICLGAMSNVKLRKSYHGSGELKVETDVRLTTGARYSVYLINEEHEE